MNHKKQVCAGPDAIMQDTRREWKWVKRGEMVAAFRGGRSDDSHFLCPVSRLTVFPLLCEDISRVV